MQSKHHKIWHPNKSNEHFKYNVTLSISETSQINELEIKKGKREEEKIEKQRNK